MLGLLIRRTMFALGLLLTSPMIIITLIEGAFSHHRSIRAFGQFKELLATVPTVVGDYLRSAFYWAVCPGVSTGVMFSYGSMVSRPDSTIKSGSVIGVHTIVGRADIGADVLIAARVSIMSGKYIHGRPGSRSNGENHEPAVTSRLSVGDHSWIGEGALILANVGCNCTVGAGSVVLKDVPDNTTVMGNPARKVNLEPALKED